MLCARLSPGVPIPAASGALPSPTDVWNSRLLRLDRTLIDVNSGLLWARHERRNGHISAVQMARALVWTALYHVAVIDMETAVTRALDHYRGVDAGHLDGRTRAWFEREVAGRLRPRAAAAMEEHRRRGDTLVILTNSSCYEARAAAERWGFDDYLANEFPTDPSGRLLGAFAPPLCYGAGKVARAETWARARAPTSPAATSTATPTPMCRCWRGSGSRGW